MARLSIVRAGAHGERELKAIEENKLFPGFNEVGDLTGYKDREEIVKHLQEVMPDAKRKRILNFASQLNRFVNTIQKGDLVVMPRKFTNGVAIGEVTGDYNFTPDDPLHKHWRGITWHKESVPRDTFKQDLRSSFGAFVTICGVERNNAFQRVRTVLETGSDPGALLGKQGTMPTKQLEEDEDEDYPTDIEDVANQQIITLIKSEFAGHELANLVAEILGTKGYTTKVSPPGPDGGVDILAAGGTLGLGEDRICVQVKSGDDVADHDVVLRLIGSVSNTQAQTGLLVSISGVNVAAQKELGNNFFKLRLWQMPDLLKALLRAYGELSDETRAKLPLKQIWVPSLREDA